MLTTISVVCGPVPVRCQHGVRAVNYRDFTVPAPYTGARAFSEPAFINLQIVLPGSESALPQS